MDKSLPISNPTYNIFNPVGLKYLICLRLELIHLTEHRYNHNFQDCINPLCRCSLEPESNSHFFLCCHHYTVSHTDLMNGLKKIYENIVILSENSLVKLRLFVDPKYYLSDNCHMDQIEKGLTSSPWKTKIWCWSNLSCFFFRRNHKSCGFLPEIL